MIRILLISFSFFLFGSMLILGKPKGVIKTNKNDKHEFLIKKFNYINQQIKTIIQNEHYSSKNIDDSFSKKIFESFFQQLDKEKLIFTKQDSVFFAKYKYQLDNDWEQKNHQFIFDVDSIHTLRIKENKVLVNEILSQPFSFDSNDSILIDKNGIYFSEDVNLHSKKGDNTCFKTKKEKWFDYLKMLSLERFSEAIEQREKNTFKDSLGNLKPKDTHFVVKNDSTLESETRISLQKNFNKMFKRFEKKFKTEEKYNIYINQFVQNIDPHTDFLPPAEKRSFDESMSKKFYGIGAQLREDDAGVKIEKILPGGPAFKSKKIFAGDFILKVGQNNDTLEDLLGYDLFDAVKLIRGKEGTTVNLIVKHPTGEIESIKLIREEVKMDEVLVKSAIITENKYKIGFLSIPEFYADFGNSSTGSQSYIDVATEIEKLKTENIDALIIDLRNNGGGSLFDVVQIAGFFIFDGPVVQIKDKKGDIRVLEDKYKWLLFSGPITVMVNELSASASEILAAAIQDYKRGIVVGSPSTYGKGTVQTTKPLGMPNNWIDTSFSDMGSLKYTIQKFYRINGNSTQKLGVIPDIILPDRLQYAKFKEQDNPVAMPYDNIKMSSYKEWMYNNYDLNSIKENSKKRVLNNPFFTSIEKNSKWLTDDSNDQWQSLNLTQYQQKRKLEKEKLNEIDSSINLIKDTLAVHLMEVDKNKFKDEDKDNRNAEWAKSLRKDLYLMENVQIIKDMIGKKEIEMQPMVTK